MKRICMMIMIMQACLLCTVFSLPAVAQDNAVTPESGAVYREGVELYSAGKYAEATEKFNEAYELDGSNIAALFADGLALNKLGRHEEAAERFTKVLETQPDHEKAMQALPIAYEQAGMYDRALETYDRFIEQQPKEPSFLTGKARVLIRQENYRAALQPLNAALEINPGDAGTRYLRARMYSELGDMAHAAEDARKVLDRDENHARARLILADHLRLSGELDRALEQYQIAARNIDTKGYADHYIQVIRQKQEEMEIEREWQARQQQQNNQQNE